MIGELIRKYKWYLTALVIVYSVVSIWLFFLTDAPQTVPFEYEIR